MKTCCHFLKRFERNCGKRAVWVDREGRFFCTQHAKIMATKKTSASHEIRPGLKIIPPERDPR